MRLPTVRAGTRRVAVAAAVLAATGAAIVGLPAGHAATTITVSGFVFRDLDNDGARDPGEPGVAGLRVHRTTGNQLPTTTTEADGSYSLTFAPSSSGYLIVESGWFRSQCAKLSCAAGPGPDNDYAVANAFIRYPMAQLTTSRSGLDVGLLPDWPGSSAAPPAPVAGVVPANAVDVASRLSWVSSTCPGGKRLICRAGDTYTVSNQVLNQGTTTVTGLQAVLDLPDGDRFATADPARDVTLLATASSPTVTGISVGAVDQSSQSVRIDVEGSLPPGGYLRVNARAKVVAGPGTAGCVVGAPTSACQTAEPQGAPLTFGVTHVDQDGDPDSFGPDCPAGAPVTTCTPGIHDKQVEPDEVDPVGHNVDAALGVDPAFDLSARVLTQVPRQGAAAPGGTVVLRASAFNTGPAVGLPGWTLTLVLPTGSNPAVPTKHALRSCSRSTNGAGFPTITCTGKGPLSPGVTSFAVDVALQVPADSLPGTNLSAVAFVAPTAAQAGAESVVAGPTPTQPTLDVTQTPTNNDASAAVPVGP